MAKELEPEDLTPRQREMYEAFIALYQVTIMRWPRKSGKTTLTNLIARKIMEQDNAY